jgi:tetratricopeptide (TPR) repeat protein
MVALDPLWGLKAVATRSPGRRILIISRVGVVSCWLSRCLRGFLHSARAGCFGWREIDDVMINRRGGTGDGKGGWLAASVGQDNEAGRDLYAAGRDIKIINYHPPIRPALPPGLSAAGGALRRFWRALEALYRAAGSPGLQRLVDLGLEQDPALSVCGAAIGRWLNGKAVPARGKSERYFAVMIAFLQAGIEPGDGCDWRSPDEWAVLLRAAQQERVASGKGRSRRKGGLSGAAPAGPGGLLIGRDREQSVLAGLVSQVAAGRGGVVLIEGEPGIGKSALAGAVLAGAVELGCQVFWGTGSELDQALPLQPLLDGLRVRDPSASPRREAIASFLRGEMVMNQGMGGPGVLAEQLLALIAEECAIRPVILVIDDLQWADQDSIRLLARLAGSARELPLLLAGLMRPVPQREELLALRRAAAGATRIQLEGLTGAASAELVAALVGGPPDAGLLRLAGDAAGNPLYITELVAALARSTHLVAADNGQVTVTEGPVPRSLAAAIADRLSFISGPVREILRSASLLGVEFAVTDLAAIQDRSIASLAGSLREACATGLLAESGARLRFRHPLIHAALYHEMPMPVRAASHRDVGRALAAAEVPADRVARQLLSAISEPGDPPEPMEEWMLSWLSETSAVLVSQVPPVAAALLARAVDSIPAGCASHSQLASRLASALYHIGENSAAEQLASRTLKQAADPDLLIELHQTLTLCRMNTGRPAEALAALARALETPGLSPRHRSRLLVLAARTYAIFGEPGMARQAAADALAAQQEGDTWTMGWATFVLAMVAVMRGELTEALSLHDHALALVRGIAELSDLRLLLQINRAAALGNLDRHEQALAAADTACQLADQVGTTVRRSQAHSTRAEALFITGRWDDALAEMAIVPQNLKEPGDACNELGMAALIAFHRGDAPTARHCLATVTPHAQRVGRRLIPLLQLARSQDAEKAGDLPQALSTLTGWLDDSTEELGMSHDLLAEATRLAMLIGDQDTAKAIASQAAESAREAQTPYHQATALYCRGLVDQDASQLLSAAEHYQQGAHPLQHATALEAAASARLHAGDRKQAQAALADAAEIYTRLGATADAGRVDAASTAACQPVAAPTRPTVTRP